MPTPLRMPTRIAFSMRRFTLLLALVAVLCAPALAHAAPPAQEVTHDDLAGVWESTRSGNGDTMRLAFFADYTVQAASTNDRGGPSIALHGVWESTGTSSFSIHFQSVDGVPNDDGIAMPGVIERRTLRLPEAAEWGEDGMTLTLIEDEPRAIADELLADNVPPPRDDSLAGVYRSNLLGNPTDDDGAGYVTLTLASDYTAEVIIESSSAETDVVETGTWRPEGHDTIALTLLTIDGEDYNSPVFITFLVDGDELLAPDITDFSAEGLLLTRVQEELASVAGLYSTVPMTTAQGVVHITLYLAEDGSLQTSGIVLAGDAASVLGRGVWAVAEDGSILVTSQERLTLGEEGRMVSEETDAYTETLIRVGNDLVGGELTFYRVGPVGEESDPVIPDFEDDILPDGDANADNEVTGAGEETTNGDTDASTDDGAQSAPSIFVSAPDQIVAGNAVILTLTEAGEATLAVTSRALDAPVSDSGTWARDEVRLTITLTLITDQNGDPLDEPQVVVYQVEPDRSLTSDDHDAERYGPNINVRLRR